MHQRQSLPPASASRLGIEAEDPEVGGVQVQVLRWVDDPQDEAGIDVVRQLPEPFFQLSELPVGGRRGPVVRRGIPVRLGGLPSAGAGHPVGQCRAAVEPGLTAFGRCLIPVPHCPPPVRGRVFPSQRGQPVRLGAFPDRFPGRIECAEFAVPFTLVARVGSDVTPQALQIPLVGSLVALGAVDVALLAVDVPLVSIDIALVGVLVAPAGMFVPLVGVLVAHLNGFAVPRVVVADHDLVGLIGHKMPIYCRSPRVDS